MVLDTDIDRVISQLLDESIRRNNTELAESSLVLKASRRSCTVPNQINGQDRRSCTVSNRINGQYRQDDVDSQLSSDDDCCSHGYNH